MFDLRPLLHPTFWLDQTPPPLTPGSARFLFTAFAIMLVLGAIVRMVASRRHEDRYVTEVFNRIGQLGVTMGFLGLVIYFFTSEQIPLFGARIWFLLWGIVLLVWVGRIVYYVLKIVPKEREQQMQEQAANKYLPQPKG